MGATGDQKEAPKPITNSFLRIRKMDIGSVSENARNSVASVTAIMGGFIVIYGTQPSSPLSYLIRRDFKGSVSFIIKERLFLSESLVATLVGIAFGIHVVQKNHVFQCFMEDVGPIALNMLNPSKVFADVRQVTYDFSLILVSIQIMAAAIALPKCG